MPDVKIPADLVSLIFNKPKVRDAISDALAIRSNPVDGISPEELSVLARSGFFQAKPNSQLLNFDLRGPANATTRIAVSEVVVYSRADADMAQLLSANLGERVALDATDGVLIADRGGLCHIRYGYDNRIAIDSGMVRRIPLLICSDVPLDFLKETSNGLTARGHSSPYPYGFADDNVQPYVKILRAKGFSDPKPAK